MLIISKTVLGNTNCNYTKNLRLYHYAGNNPLKYIDPTGKNDSLSFLYEMLEQSYGSEGADYIFENDSSIQFMCTVNAASNGNIHAQKQLKYSFHEVCRETLNEISEKSNYASLVLLVIGQPEGAAIFSSISTAADILLALDDFNNRNFGEAAKKGGLIIAGYASPALLKKGTTALSKSIQITIGASGKYYELGKSIKSEDALRKLLIKDIASGYFGQEIIPNTLFIVEEAVKIYKKLTEEDYD